MLEIVSRLPGAAVRTRFRPHRFFGFLAGPRRSKMLALARQLLQVEHPYDVPVSTGAQVAFQCPVCATPMILVEGLSAAKLCRLIDTHRDAFHDSS
jgi:hypothetical protein